ncbi:hypothetical protein AB833_18925 [Chromatiales bacterium (ex Bugula neritina AB1)]|nr:hypothetical protein AB833_18925 [Chromatiales bacterium (ex Bugula neritina AB1)]
MTDSSILRNSIVPALETVRRKSTVMALAVALSACGGGGSEPQLAAANSISGGNSQLLESVGGNVNRVSLNSKSAFSDDEIRHFLSRTHFGIERGKTEEIQRIGLSVYIDEMMDYAAPDSRIFEDEARSLLLNDGDPAGLEGKFPGSSDVVEWNIYLLMNNPNAFQEVMGMFWQDHFGVDFVGFRSDEDHLMIDFINMLRERGVGNFRDLMVDVSRHGAMLLFLDGADNSKFAPNENFAREFWELFSFGVDNGYTEEDIIESSRAFTGWRRNKNPVTGLTRLVFDPESKAIGSKQPLKNVIDHDLSQDDYSKMVDLTMAQSGAGGKDLVAVFLAEKLLRHFVSENPDPALVDEFASVLRQNRLNLAPALKSLFLSEAFYSDMAREGLVRDYFEQVVGLVRTTGMTETNGQYRRYLTEMGSIPSRPPSVEGWPEGDDKISSQSSGVELPNFVNELISNRTNQENDGYDIGAALQPAGATGAPEVIDHVAMLLGVSLESGERARLIEFMNTEVDSDGVETPVNYTPQNTSHQSRKLRNLVWIICQHPDFQIK